MALCRASRRPLHHTSLFLSHLLPSATSMGCSNRGRKIWPIQVFPSACLISMVCLPKPARTGSSPRARSPITTTPPLWPLKTGNFHKIYRDRDAPNQFLVARLNMKNQHCYSKFTPLWLLMVTALSIVNIVAIDPDLPYSSPSTGADGA